MTLDVTPHLPLGVWDEFWMFSSKWARQRESISWKDFVMERIALKEDGEDRGYRIEMKEESVG